MRDANQTIIKFDHDRNFKNGFEEKENMLLAEDYFLKARKIYEIS